MKENILLAVLVSALALTSGVADCQPDSVYEGQWSVRRDGLRLQASVTPAVALETGKTKLMFALRAERAEDGSGTPTVRLSSDDGRPGEGLSEIRVKNKTSGEYVPLTYKGLRCFEPFGRTLSPFSPERCHRIGKGESLADLNPFDLRDLFRMDSPGLYSVAVSTTVSSGDKFSMIRVPEVCVRVEAEENSQEPRASGDTAFPQETAFLHNLAEALRQGDGNPSGAELGGFPDEVEQQLRSVEWTSESSGLRLKLVGRTVKDDTGMRQVWLFCFVKNCSVDKIPAIEYMGLPELFLWNPDVVPPSGERWIFEEYQAAAKACKAVWYDPILPNAEKRFFLRFPLAWTEIGKHKINLHRRVYFTPDGNYNGGGLPKESGTLDASFSFDNTKAMPPEGLRVPEEKKFEDLPSWLPMP